MAAVLAGIAAVLLALASTVEQNAARQRPATETLKLSLLSRLAREPRWLVGMGLALVSFPIEATALGVGSLVVVEPILAAGIALAVPIQWIIWGGRLSALDIVLAFIVAGALATFLVVGRLTGGNTDGEMIEWIAAGAAAAVFAAVLAGTAVRHTGAVRAGLLGTAAGAVFGIQAALVKATAAVLADRTFLVLVNWHLYALVLTGVTALVLEQSAYQAGALASSVAATKLMTAVAAVAMGMLLFDERIASSGINLVVALVALSVAFAALAALSLSHTPTEGPTAQKSGT
jgi:hypothetical protein